MYYDNFILKLFISLYVLFSIKLSKNQPIITSEFRRFYLKAMDYHQRDYKYLNSDECCGNKPKSGTNCLTPCSRYARLVFRSGDIITRDLSDVAVGLDGMFLIDALVFNDTIPVVFKNPLSFKLEIVESVTNKLIFSYAMENITMAPNSEKSWDKLLFADANYFSAFLSFRCLGYTGYNCQFRCDTSSKKIDCEFTTGAELCINGKKNPPLCDRDYAPCINSSCLNGGICEEISTDNIVCHCPPGYEGFYCQIQVCEINCDYEHGKCVDGKTCQCETGYAQPDCSKATCLNYDFCGMHGICIVRNNVPFCQCDSYTYAGQFCDKNCSNPCVYGQCFFNGSAAICICDQGYDGEFCDESLPIQDAIYESGYIPVYRQKIIAISVAAAFLIFAIFLFGISSYLKHNADRNIGIINRTTYILSELKSENPKVFNQSGDGNIY